MTKVLTESRIQAFDRIYSTDLIYVPDCWKLCGDGHCCNFSRYKSQFTMIGQHHRQELPLLPGEFEYLEHKGWIPCFGEVERRIIEYPLSVGMMKVEFMVGRSKPCTCEHATRTTTCRLYPLLPVYEITGAVVHVDTNFGILEEVEELDKLPKACEIRAVPLGELGKFMTIASEIGRDPLAVFYVMVYRLTKLHARQQLMRSQSQQPASALRLLETNFLLRRLLDQSVLRPQIEALAAQFRGFYGARFRLSTKCNRGDVYAAAGITARHL